MKIIPEMLRILAPGWQYMKKGEKLVREKGGRC